MISNLAASQGGFTSNVFLVTGERTVLIDVGHQFDVVRVAREHVDEVDDVVLTHTHPDHVGNLASVREAFDVDVYGFDPSIDGVEVAIGDDEHVRLGDHAYRALHTPGHKNDHLCFYAEETGVLFAGDLIFANGGFGRTDLEEGDHPALVESIERVYEIVQGHLTEIHTGHGPSVDANPLEDVELALQAARMSA